MEKISYTTEVISKPKPVDYNLTQQSLNSVAHIEKRFKKYWISPKDVLVVTDIEKDFLKTLELYKWKFLEEIKLWTDIWEIKNLSSRDIKRFLKIFIGELSDEINIKKILSDIEFDIEYIIKNLKKWKINDAIEKLAELLYNKIAKRIPILLATTKATWFVRKLIEKWNDLNRYKNKYFWPNWKAWSNPKIQKLFENIRLNSKWFSFGKDSHVILNIRSTNEWKILDVPIIEASKEWPKAFALIMIYALQHWVKYIEWSAVPYWDSKRRINALIKLYEKAWATHLWNQKIRLEIDYTSIYNILWEFL